MAATNDVKNDQVSQTAYSNCASPSKERAFREEGVSFAGIDRSRDNRSFSSKKMVGKDLQQRPDAPAEDILGTGENIINTVSSNFGHGAPELNSEYEETPILVGSKGNPLEVSQNEPDKKNSLRQKT